MNKPNRYLIDCFEMSRQEYSQIFERLTSIYDIYKICLDKPRCFTITRCDIDPPLDEVFTPPPKCYVYPL